jgi:hypothetical protein
MGEGGRGEGWKGRREKGRREKGRREWVGGPISLHTSTLRSSHPINPLPSPFSLLASTLYPLK